MFYFIINETTYALKKGFSTAKNDIKTQIYLLQSAFLQFSNKNLKSINNFIQYLKYIYLPLSHNNVSFAFLLNSNYEIHCR